MCKKLIYSISLVLLLSIVSFCKAEPFSLEPTQDGHVCNDTQYGPDQVYSTDGIHVRNQPGAPRCRVGYLMYDISEIKKSGRVFSNVSISVLGYNTGNITVYGIIEEIDHLFVNLQFTALTWNSVPGGVQNNPTPAINSVALDLADLTAPLVTFYAPSKGTRASTDVSQALTDFLNSDSDGVIVLLLAPSAEGVSAIIRSIRYTDGGARLEGELGGLTTSAYNPNPANEDVNVPRDCVLSWTPGYYADKHNVYFGTVFEDVNAANENDSTGILVGKNQDANTYEPTNVLKFDQTYYWRVDEVNAPPNSDVIYRGDLWSFTVEPFEYKLTNITATATGTATGSNPANTINDFGLDVNDLHSMDSAKMWFTDKDPTTPVWIQYDFDRIYKLQKMLVWNYNGQFEDLLGFGFRNVTIQYYDGTSWVTLGNFEFNQGPGEDDYECNTTIDFGGVFAKQVKITANSNWGGRQYGLSEVRFFHIPVIAWQPTPASEANSVPLDAILNWRTGREATAHQVFLSSDREAVEGGTALVGTVDRTRFALNSLGFGLDLAKTYYWRVDEVNEAGVWQGDLWSFTTTDYLIVDDFEQYDDICNRIYYAWQDGSRYPEDAACGVEAYSGNQTGSIVGNDNIPYAEQTIVRPGSSQSIPFEYNNTVSPYYSEAQRQWASAQDWTRAGANTLTLHVRGEAPAFVEFSPGNIVMNGMGTDIFGTADQGRFACKQLSGDGSIIARVDSLTNTNEWAMAGVMIRESLVSSSSFAYLIYAGQNGARFRARLTAGGEATSDTSVATAEQKAARAPVWIKLERKGDQLNGYYSTDAANPVWTPMAWNPQTITMSGNVYIGLAVTSHVTGVVCGARFSSVSTEGAVTGDWQLADLGVAQSNKGNSLETFYVILEDSLGNSKIINNTDSAMIATGEWVQWQIPLTDFTGVNSQSIKKMSIGVGNMNATTAGGTGKIYIDDIRLY
jgi:hypothetical protein